MLPWCLNFIFSRMSPTKQCCLIVLHMVCEMYIKEYQYDHCAGNFAYKNVRLTANLYMHVGLMSCRISAQTVASGCDVEYI